MIKNVDLAVLNLFVKLLSPSVLIMDKNGAAGGVTFFWPLKPGMQEKQHWSVWRRLGAFFLQKTTSPKITLKVNQSDDVGQLTNELTLAVKLRAADSGDISL